MENDTESNTLDLNEPLLEARSTVRRGPANGGSDNAPTQISADAEDNDSEFQFSTQEIKLVLILGQWTWPAILWMLAGMSSDPWEIWIVSMAGNGLMVAYLAWTAHTEGATLEGKEVLPTIVWGILPSFDFIMNRYHWTEEVLLVLGLLFFFLSICVLAIRCRNVGIDDTCRWLCLQPSSYFSRNCTIFKHLEEEYFEELRAREDEENAQLQAQQASLRYLETATISEPPKWPIYVFAGILMWVIFLLMTEYVKMESFQIITVAPKIQHMHAGVTSPGPQLRISNHSP